LERTGEQTVHEKSAAHWAAPRKRKGRGKVSADHPAPADEREQFSKLFTPRTSGGGRLLEKNSGRKNPGGGKKGLDGKTKSKTESKTAGKKKTSRGQKGDRSRGTLLSRGGGLIHVEGG